MAIGTRGKSKTAAKSRRHARLRKKVIGTEERPRLVVTRSARHVFVQVVDDSRGHTVASASTLESDLRTFDGDKTAKARKVGELIAEVLDGLSQNGEEGNAAVEQAVKAKAHELTGRFPIY